MVDWVIVNAFEEEGDAEIKLMCFNQITNTFKWPSREDKCLFPLTKYFAKYVLLHRHPHI